MDKRDGEHSKVDDNEDGARAKILDEAIAAIAFGFARERSMLRHAIALPDPLLKQISGLVRDLEVADAEMWRWQNAILDGFRMFNRLNQARGGTIRVDLERMPHMEWIGDPEPGTS